MVAGVPSARPGQAAGEVVADLLAHSYDCQDVICMVDDEDRLVGVVPLARPLSLPRETPLGGTRRETFPRAMRPRTRSGSRRWPCTTR